MEKGRRVLDFRTRTKSSWVREIIQRKKQTDSDSWQEGETLNYSKKVKRTRAEARCETEETDRLWETSWRLRDWAQRVNLENETQVRRIRTRETIPREGHQTETGSKTTEKHKRKSEHTTTGRHYPEWYMYSVVAFTDILNLFIYQVYLFNTFQVVWFTCIFPYY